MSSHTAYIPSKIDLTPKRHHGYAVLLFILGTLLPPLGQSLVVTAVVVLTSPAAVAARFGIGTDFWINVVLTLCGYVPGML